MSKPFDLISGIEEEVQTPKVKHQVFEAQLGFERVEVAVPLDSADAFVSEATAKNPKSITSLNKLAAKFGGKVL